MICPTCPHDMILHDGDGDETAPYECRASTCGCAFMIGLHGPERVLVDAE